LFLASLEFISQGDCKMKKNAMDASLKVLVENEINRVWTSSAEYIKSKLTNAYITTDGRIVIFEKPTIKTTFCFGYGQNGISTNEDEDRAHNNCQASKEKDVFFANNIEENFGNLEKIMADPVIFRNATYHEPNGNLWKVEERHKYTWGWEDRKYIELPEKDKDGIRAKLEEEKAKFIKRLETYWKRYGNTKLHTWTYLVD